MKLSLRKRSVLALCSLSTVGALAACNGGGLEVPGAPEAQEDTAVQGNATPAKSPEAQDPAGTVIDFDQVSDIQAVGDTVAVRAGDTLFVGSTEELESGKAAEVELPSECGLMSTAHVGFVFGCGKEVLTVDPKNPSQPASTPVDEEFPVTVAAIVDSGELFVGSDEVAEVSMYVDGQRKENFTVGAPSDQLISVSHADHNDAVVRTNRGDTTIQNLDWGEAREGGRLRVGVALGQMSVGSNGTILVSDTGGRRLAVYTSTDAVRLHQYGNIDGSPWAVAWDANRNLAWVTATDNNTAQAFDISSGAPEPVGSVQTIANAQHMAVTESGTVVIGSATGDGLQIISDPDINA